MPRPLLLLLMGAFAPSCDHQNRHSWEPPAPWSGQVCELPTLPVALSIAADEVLPGSQRATQMTVGLPVDSCRRGRKPGAQPFRYGLFVDAQPLLDVQGKSLVLDALPACAHRNLVGSELVDGVP